jgi:2-dehydropantoate 2-reductase
MRYVVIGSGAVGCAIGTRLALSGREVVVVGRPREGGTSRSSEIRLSEPGRPLRAAKVLRAEGLESVPPREDDVLLVTVKGYDTDDVARAIAGRYGPTTPVLSLQNGVRNEERLAVASARILGGVVSFCATRTSADETRLTRGNRVGVGVYPAGWDPLAHEIARDLASGGFESQTHDSVVDLKWGKLLLNCNNAHLTLVGETLERAWSTPETAARMADVIDEGRKVLDQAGIRSALLGRFPHPSDYADALRAGAVAVSGFEAIPPEDRTLPSTAQDLLARRGRTEAQDLNGEIVRLGAALSIETPLNRMLLDLVEERARLRLPPGGFSGPELWARARSAPKSA